MDQYLKDALQKATESINNMTQEEWSAYLDKVMCTKETAQAQAIAPLVIEWLKNTGRKISSDDLWYHKDKFVDLPEGLTKENLTLFCDYYDFEKNPFSFWEDGECMFSHGIYYLENGLVVDVLSGQGTIVTYSYGHDYKWQTEDLSFTLTLEQLLSYINDVHSFSKDLITQQAEKVLELLRRHIKDDRNLSYNRFIDDNTKAQYNIKDIISHYGMNVQLIELLIGDL